MEKDGFQPNDTGVDRHLQQLTRRRDKGEKGEAIEFRLIHLFQSKTHAHLKWLADRQDPRRNT